MSDSIHVEGNIEYYKIGSLATLQDSIIFKSVKILVVGGQNLLKAVFHYTGGLQKVDSLIIKTKNFNYFLINSGLQKLIKNGLQHLRIEAESSTNIDEFLSHLKYYSELKSIEIQLEEYSLGSAKEAVDRKCLEIVQRNQEVNKFLEELEDYKKREQVLSRLLNASVESLQDAEIKEAVAIASKKSLYINLSKYHNKLADAAVFNTLLNIAKDWDVVDIVQKSDIQKLNRILPFLANFNINTEYTIVGGHSFGRLIDFAVGSSVEMVEFLYSLEAELYRATANDEMPSPLAYYCNIDRDLPNFPFWVAISRGTPLLKDFFLAKEEALYDGLAWIIYANELATFNALLDKCSSLDFNQLIPKGVFVGFTLFQLIVFYKRVEFFVKVCEKKSHAILTMANSIFPIRDGFEHGGWSVAAVVIYTGKCEELEYIIKELDFARVGLRNPSNYNALQLVLSGAAEVVYRENYPTDLIENYKKCLRLLSGIVIDTDVTLNDEEHEANIPLLHFCVIKGIFHLIVALPQYYSSHIRESVYLKFKRHSEGSDARNGTSEQRFNVLQLAAHFSASYLRYGAYEQEEQEEQELLFAECGRNGLAASITEPVGIWDGLNLFQYGVAYNRFMVFQTLLKWKECPINTPFPSIHEEYPGWLPIHVIIIEMIEKGMTSIFLEEILKREDLDITVPFLANGKPNYIEGYYPSSAIFFKGNPVKNSQFVSHIYSECIKCFVPRFESLTGRNKTMVLNQALFYAILHHDIRQGCNHEEAIQLLVEKGANPYQSFNENDLIIDLAREQGLLHLFPQHIDTRFNTTNAKVLRWHGNSRDSEFTEVSPIPLHVNEDYYSVITLVRNEKCDNPEHVFIVVEQIVKGRNLVHFIDFVKDLEHIGFGKVRHDKKSGRMSDKLLSSCRLSMMRIESLESLRCQYWELPNEACADFLAAVEEDKDKAERIQYVLPGDRSICARSSSKKGHNCYTWAREKLLATKSLKIERALRPTIEEWLGTLPSLKDKSWYKNKCFLFTAAMGGLGLAALCVTKYYSNGDGFPSCKLEP